MANKDSLRLEAKTITEFSKRGLAFLNDGETTHVYCPEGRGWVKITAGRYAGLLTDGHAVCGGCGSDFKRLKGGDDMNKPSCEAIRLKAY